MRAAVAVGDTLERQFEVVEVPRPEPNEGQVRVRVRAAGLNRGELIHMARTMSTDVDRPQPGGIEFAGEVDQLGGAVTDWVVGERVMGRAPHSLAEFVCADARALMKIPASVNWEEAGGFPNTFVTAHDALATAAKVRPGDAVLVNAASSGIGVAAVQIARLIGATTVIATSRSTDKLAALARLRLSPTHVAVHDGQVGEAVLAATGGRGVDIVVDSLGGICLEQNVKLLAIEGRLISVGRTASAVGALDLDHLSRQRASIIGVTFRTRTPDEALRCSERCAADLLGALGSGDIKVIVDSTFSIDDIAAAQRHMLTDNHLGKIVVTF
ncbi:MAG: zinc-binding dehydrogenase [Ilumatobacteraceae bacterium]